MKKLLIFLLTTTIASAIYIQSKNLPMNTIQENTECEACHQGVLKSSKQGVIFEFTPKGIEPVFDAPFLKCNHCAVLVQPKKFENGYFNIPEPKGE